MTVDMLASRMERVESETLVEEVEEMSGIGEFSEEKRRGNCPLLRRKFILLRCGRTIGGQSTGACPSLGFSWVGTLCLQYSQLNSWCLSVDPALAPKAPELTFLAPHIAQRCEFGAMGLEVMSTTVGTGLCPDLRVLLSQHQRHPSSGPGVCTAGVHPPTQVPPPPGN